MKWSASMARRSPEDRPEKLVAAATRVFIEQGYRRTQVADVAAALGVAKGTIYLAVESKEALFDLALRYADAPTPFANPPKLPVPTPRAGATLRFVREKLASNRVPPTLAAAARRRPRDVAAELEQIVCELYDVLAANRWGIKLIDRCAPDYPELASLWFVGARGGLMDLLSDYLADRIRGRRLRPVPDARVAARLIIETTVYWAVHRHWDAHPQTVDEGVARASVVRFVVGALAPEKAKEKAA
ncbi:MAG TPA: helix-turn-helix domain-containing protein [Candidatus Binatia bacterium]|nr:helix-turn-helix domain-containing protein [Candidatus Binatia bacterium]